MNAVQEGDCPDKQSDEALARRAGKGDEDAFACLVHRHMPMVLGLAARYRGPWLEPEDLAQEGLLGLLSAAATAGRTDFYLVGGFDYNDTFIEELQKGKGNTVLYSFAAQDCFEIGSKAFELAVEAAKGNLPAEKNVLVPGELVSMETLDDYLETYNFYQEQILAYQ